MNVKRKDAPRTKRGQSEQTRALLLARARALFARLGYAYTSTEKILQGTKLTRGALYHQFRDKEDLFRAVLVEVHREIGARIEAAVRGIDPKDGLRAGCRAFFDATLLREIQQILIIDGPAVLGWGEWNRLDRKHGFGLLLTGIRATGALERSEIEPFAVMLNGALNEGAAWAARAEDPSEAVERVKAVLDRFLPRAPA